MDKKFGNFLSLEPGMEVAEVAWNDGGARSIFQAVGRVPHVCRDGREIELRVWASRCWVCGCAFQMATPMSVSLEATTFTRRCCDEHRSTPEQRGKNARAASLKAKAARKKSVKK